MNWRRLVAAAFAALVTYFVYGGVTFGLLPWLMEEYRKYPAVYRPAEGIQKLFPVGIAATFVAILVVAVLYARGLKGSGGAGQGARFGALLGIFAVCGFVLHNYVNLNIGLKLTLEQAAAYFLEWLLVGLVIGLIYKPRAAGSS